MKAKLFALVDCNNFYVSCERSFDTSLRERPVIVMSNNDGCVIARSNEVKRLGVKMGQPIFQIQGLIKQHNIHLFSSNFSLYGDMSERVMQVLRMLCPKVEVYSIDEAFLDLSDLAIEDRAAFGRQIAQRVMQYTGLPVSVGIAPTKALAKIAAKQVKKQPAFEGALDISTYSVQEMDSLLSGIPAEDIWGIGRQYSKYLRGKGIITARDVKYADEKWMRKKLTVVGERIVLELRGISCLPIETMTKKKKGIMSAKSFSRPVEDFEELYEALANYTATCAEKLRQQDSLAATITVFLRTSMFRNQPQYSDSFTVTIPYPTSFTPELFLHARQCLKVIYKPGYRYQKVGVAVSHITPDETVQPDLFDDFSLEAHYQRMRLMAIMDAINHIYGRDTLYFAVQGVTRSWKMKQEHLSGCFTTKWSDILTAH